MNFRNIISNRPVLALVTTGLIAFSTPAAALPPLSQDDHVTGTLVSAAVGEEIRNKCSRISARMLRALSKARALERYARNLGYSEAEVKAFLKSKPERARIVELTRNYMLANGVVEGQEETYCALGKAEIAKGTLTGFLLFAW